MRLFFALPLPAQLQLDLDLWCGHSLSAAIDRIPAKNYHMTLAFLGDVAASQLDTLIREADLALTSLTQAESDRTIRIDQSGYFPKPGIFWIGPTSWPNILTQLAQSLQQIGNRLGCQRVRQHFQPHISLIRHCTEVITPLKAPNFILTLDEIVLFESRQIRSGVEYQALEGWPMETVPSRHFPNRPSLPRRPKP